MDTFSNEGRGRRQRRKHSDEFKAQAVAACRRLGMSMAAIAMDNGVNANLLRRWVIEAERGADSADAAQLARAIEPTAGKPSLGFVALQLAGDTEPPAIRIELRRGTTTINVVWPVSAAADCACWMRELLR